MCCSVRVEGERTEILFGGMMGQNLWLRERWWWEVEMNSKERFREKKSEVKRCIYQSKKEVNEQFGKVYQNVG